MKNDDISMMKKYGITCEQVNIYHYKQYQYTNLQDAINYAKHAHANIALKDEKIKQP